jgi:hypothetical protein
MSEFLPPFAGWCLGSSIFFLNRSRLRTFVGIAGILAIALAAVTISGEFRITWTYLLPDLAEAAAGIAGGFALMRWVLRSSSPRKKVISQPTN